MGDVGLLLTSLVQTVEEQWNGKDLVGLHLHTLGLHSQIIGLFRLLALLK